MAALTLTTALANAQTVLNDRTQCLNENFELDKVLTHKATYEQLIAKINALNIPDSNKEKRRLLVIIRMTNPPEEKPKNFEDLKAAIVKMCSGPKPPSPEELAKQKQKELSLLLAAHELMQMEKLSRAARIKNEKELSALQIQLEELLEDPFIFPLLVLHLKASMEKDPSTGKLNYVSYAGKPPSFYAKIKKYLAHPNPIIRRVIASEIRAKEITENSYALKIMPFFQECLQFARENLYSDSANHHILKELYPDFIKLMDYLIPQFIKIGRGEFVPEFYENRELLNSDSSEIAFQKKYQQLHAELQALQEKHFPKKEAFLKRFGGRVLDTYIPKSVKAATFPLPGNVPPIEKILRIPKEEQQAEKDKKKVEETPKTKPKKDREKPSEHFSIKPLEPKEKSPQIEVAKPEPEPVVDSSSFMRRVLADRSFPFDEVDYDKRVLDWFSKREAAPIKFTPEDAVWKHAFSRIVDRFLGTPYCFRDTWKNETTGNDDPCFCILVDITLPSKETIPGVFQFTFDKNWKCYHRWFGPMSNIERLDKVISQKRDKIDFPPLRKPEKPKLEELDRTKFEIDPYFDSITFKDEQNDLIIKIYRVEE